MSQMRFHSWVFSVLLALAALAPAFAAGGPDADTVDGFDAVQCHKRIQKRGESLVATCKNGRLPGNIILVAPDSKKLKGRTFNEVIEAAEADLDCTGCVQGIELDTGDAPNDGQILSFDQGTLEWRDLGGITSVSGGSGITGGGSQGDVVLALDPTYRLPQSCADNQIAKWNDGNDTWTCQDDIDTDSDTTYSAGSGLSLSGTEFAIVSSFRLPQSCDSGRIAKWDGSGWICALDADTTYLAGTGLDLSGTTFNVDPAEVQSRIDGDCVEGSAIRAVNQDGSVTCETDDVGAAVGLLDVGAYCDQLVQEVSYGPCFGLRSPVDTSGDVGQRTAIAIGADGLPIVLYTDVSNDDTKILHCGVPVCTSGNATTTLATTNPLGGSVAIGTDGLPLAIYRNPANGLIAAHCGSADCTTGNSFFNVGSSAGLSADFAFGADGRPIISYMQSGNFATEHCNDPDCSGGGVAGGGSESDNVGIQNSIAVGTDDLPIIAIYYGGSGAHDLKVLHCGNASCNSGNTLTAVDTAGTVGGWPSIAIGSDGLPIASYWDATNGHLKVVHCGNVACSSGNTITAIDPSGEVGGYTSIAIGVDGVPIIGYYDDDNGDLRVLHCGNVGCTSGNDSIALDTTGNVGQGTSIAIGADGTPVVSYYDVTNGDLKIALVPLG